MLDVDLDRLLRDRQELGDLAVAVAGRDLTQNLELARCQALVGVVLGELGARSDRPLTVVLERDGNLPSFDALLAEISRARAALASGRAAREVPAA